MYRNYIEQLAQSAIEDLYNIPKISLIKQIKRFARKYIKRELVEPIDHINWPKGCLMAGLTATGYNAPVQQYLDQWIKMGAKIYTVDDCLAGQALLDVYKTTEIEKYLQAADKMMNFLYQHEKDEQESLPYRPLHKTNHIYADGIGMICPFAVHYSIIKEEKAAMELAIKQIRNFIQNGINKENELPYHIYQYAKQEKLGMNGWGRAVGWIAYGIAASLDILRKNCFEPVTAEQKDTRNPNAQDGKKLKKNEWIKPYVQELEAYLKQIMESVVPYQTKEGLYTSCITDASSPIDSSATAMILYADRVWKAENSQSAISQKFFDLIQDGQVVQAQSECIGIGQYGTKYGSYPWSVGMTLKLLS